MRRRRDFLKCYRKGRRRHGALAILYSSPNDVGHPRLGITVSRKVGNSVVRHRVRRRVREVYRRWNRRSELPSLDVVVHVRPDAARGGFDELQDDLMRLLAGLLTRIDHERP